MPDGGTVCRQERRDFYIVYVFVVRSIYTYQTECNYNDRTLSLNSVRLYIITMVLNFVLLYFEQS